MISSIKTFTVEAIGTASNNPKNPNNWTQIRIERITMTGLSPNPFPIIRGVITVASSICPIPKVIRTYTMCVKS